MLVSSTCKYPISNPTEAPILVRLSTLIYLTDLLYLIIDKSKPITPLTDLVIFCKKVNSILSWLTYTLAYSLLKLDS